MRWKEIGHKNEFSQSSDGLMQIVIEINRTPLSAWVYHEQFEW